MKPRGSRDSQGPRRSGCPSLLWRSFLAGILPRFAGALALFLSIFLLADLFGSLWRFLASEAPLGRILFWLALGIPEHAVQALPVSLLFAATYTLAETHASGELTVIFGSGISLVRYSLPLIALCAFACVAGFAFEDAAGIPARNARADLSRELLRQKAQFSSSDITLMSRGGIWLYRVGFYDDAALSLNDVDIVGRDGDFRPETRITADRAIWEGGLWSFRNVRIYRKAPSGTWTVEERDQWTDPGLDERPASFRSIKGDIAGMRRPEIAEYAGFLRQAGLPASAAVSELHRRYAFALAPLVVGFLAAASGGLFRKNAMLMSLLLSLSAATAYYVAQMLGMLMAKTGAMAPELGAWAPTLIFLIGSAVFFARTRT